MNRKPFDSHEHYWRKARQLLKLSASEAAECSVMPFFADWQSFRSRVEWQLTGGTNGWLAPMLDMVAGMKAHIGPRPTVSAPPSEPYEIRWGHYYTWPMFSVAHMPGQPR